MKITNKKQQVINEAMNIIRENMATYKTAMTSSTKVKELMTIKLATEEREHFVVMFLNSAHHLIADEIMFSGTLAAAAVYPREVAKRALELNAASVILAHNHPSGAIQPSQADRDITIAISKTLRLFDIRVLDHIIVGNGTYSFSENGERV